MKKLMTMAASFAIILPMTLARPALADGKEDCTTAPKAEWKSEDDIKNIAKELGYEVRKIELEGSCYEVYGISKKGDLMELFFDPKSGKIVDSEKKS